MLSDSSAGSYTRHIHASSRGRTGAGSGDPRPLLSPVHAANHMEPARASESDSRGVPIRDEATQFGGLSFLRYYSIRQADFSVQFCFEADSDNQARVRALFLMTAIRGEAAWGKNMQLRPLQAQEVQAPFFASSYFADLDPLLPKIRSYIQAREAGQAESE